MHPGGTSMRFLAAVGHVQDHRLLAEVEVLPSRRPGIQRTQAGEWDKAVQVAADGR